MFNTFEPERLQDAVGIGRCTLGMPFVQAAALDGGSRLRATVGAAGQRTLLDRQRWVNLFNASGLPAALRRWRKVMRRKAPNGRTTAFG